MPDFEINSVCWGRRSDFSSERLTPSAIVHPSRRPFESPIDDVINPDDRMVRYWCMTGEPSRERATRHPELARQLDLTQPHEPHYDSESIGSRQPMLSPVV